MEGGGRKRQYAVRSTIRRALTCGSPSISLPIVPTRARRAVEGTTFI